LKQTQLVLLNSKIFLALAALAAGCAPMAVAAKKPAESPRPDAIEVVGHVALDGKLQQNLLVSEHWRRQYLYAQSQDGKETTVIDVTSVSSPKVVRKIATRVPGQQLGGVVGTAALEIATEGTPNAKPARTVSITSLTDSDQPKVVRQFTNVTDVLRDSQRGLIYLVNDQGLYILQEQPAVDQQLEDEYGAYVLNNH
jgi:hypothetical protein